MKEKILPVRRIASTQSTECLHSTLYVDAAALLMRRMTGPISWVYILPLEGWLLTQIAGATCNT